LSALRILQDYRFLATRPRKAQFPDAPVLPESFIGSLVAVPNNDLLEKLRVVEIKLQPLPDPVTTHAFYPGALGTG
jgi:hypothetical protein